VRFKFAAMSDTFTLKYRSANKKIALIDLHVTSRSEEDLVIFCHGFKGFRRWGYWPYLHTHFTAAGYAFAVFDHSHNGTRPEDPMNFSDLSAFAQNTISVEQQDIREVISALRAEMERMGKTLRSVNLLGHSRGGANAILFAARNTGIDRVITWNAISGFGGLFHPAIRDSWREQGRIHIDNHRTGQSMPLDYVIMEDFLRNGEDYDVLKQASLLVAPLLILHGEQDDSVDIAQGRMIFEACLHSVFIPVEHGGHTFGVSHPWEEGKLIPKTLEFAIDNSLEFLEEL
jgi:pimeloyl-ACP methyl ester carboxylesterase